MSTHKPAQFTPGPWAVKPMGKQLFIESEYPSALTSFVCDMQFPDCQSDEERETAHANAHLIAAAPAMYAALREAEKHLTDLANYGAEGIPEPLLVSVRSAIAQAEGRQA